MNVHRIYFSIDDPSTEHHIAWYLQGIDYTIYKAVGSWEGIEEPSYVIETIDLEEVRDIAYILKTAFRQSAVLVTTHQVEAEML